MILLIKPNTACSSTSTACPCKQSLRNRPDHLIKCHPVPLNLTGVHIHSLRHQCLAHLPPSPVKIDRARAWAALSRQVPRQGQAAVSRHLRILKRIKVLLLSPAVAMDLKFPKRSPPASSSVILTVATLWISRKLPRPRHLPPSPQPTHLLHPPHHLPLPAKTLSIRELRVRASRQTRRNGWR